LGEGNDGRGLTGDEIRISNSATYWPVSPIDLVVGAPIATRLLLGVTPIGRAVHVVVLGAYLGSALRDWRDRRGVRPIAFRQEFGADIDQLVPMPRERREAEVRALAGRLNDEFTATAPSRQELAVEVDRHLTGYIAGITGQRVRTSVAVREFTLARFAFPFARGMCDLLSGDIAIFQDAGPLEAHVIAHEFCHRKGYWTELYAQAIAYLSLASSGDPVLRQSARAERFYRHLRVLAGQDDAMFERLVAATGLRAELRRGLANVVRPRRAPRGIGRGVEAAMRRLYDARMRVTGQNGLTDYDLGFTNFLYTFETSATARQTPPAL
jgi:hypothetical protein